MHDYFGLTQSLQDMSPVHIPRGFTKSFIRGDVVEDLASEDRRGACQSDPVQ